MTNTEKENYLITLEDGSVLDCHTLGTKCTKEQNQTINLYLVKIIRNRDKDKELAAEATEIFFKRNDALFTRIVDDKLTQCYIKDHRGQGTAINYFDMKQEVLTKILKSLFYNGDDSKLQSTILFYAIKATQNYISKELVSNPIYQNLSSCSDKVSKKTNSIYCKSHYEFITYIKPLKVYCNDNRVEIYQLTENDIKNIAIKIAARRQNNSIYDNNQRIALTIKHINNIINNSIGEVEYIDTITNNIGITNDKLNPEAIAVENEKRELIHKAISHLTNEQQYIVYNYKLFGFGDATLGTIVESLGYMDKYSTIASAKESVSLEVAKIKKILAKELSDTLYSKEKACAS